ncbi:hypothetical protein WME94_38585 [Sorangium sp. So ce429]
MCISPFSTVPVTSDTLGSQEPGSASLSSARIATTADGELTSLHRASP